MRYWVLGRDNQPKGPYPGSHIMQGMAQGKVAPERLVCREGEQEWLAVRDVPELNGLGGLPELPDIPDIQSISVVAAASEPRGSKRGAATSTGSFTHSSAVSTREYTKDQRISLINRRTASFMIEYFVILIVVGTIAGVLTIAGFSDIFARMSEIEAMTLRTTIIEIFALIGVVLWLLARDVVPGLAWCRRWLCLRVVDAKTGQTPSMLARASRNLTFIIPYLGFLIEYFVAYYSPKGMPRLGDLMTGTRVIDTDPNGRGQRRHTAWMLLAVALFLTPCCLLIGIVAMAAAAATAAGSMGQ